MFHDLQVKIKKLHPDAVIPKYAKPGDAGMDLTCVSKEINYDYGFLEYGTGLSFEIPEGYVGLLFPRSSISKTYFTLANSVGVLDSNFRGEVKLRFFGNCMTGKAGDSFMKKHNLRFLDNVEYKIGDRIGQLVIMPYPEVEFVEVDELSETERGTGGYGSTGA